MGPTSALHGGLGSPCETHVGPTWAQRGHAQYGHAHALRGGSTSDMQGKSWVQRGHAQLELPVQNLRGSHLGNAEAELAKIRAKRGHARVGPPM